MQMVGKFLDDIVLIAHSKNIEIYTDSFVKQWQSELEDLGFIIDSGGRILGVLAPLLTYELKVMKEYIMLRFLFTHTAKGFSADNRDCCRSSWERKNVSIQSQLECSIALDSISAKLKNSLTD